MRIRRALACACALVPAMALAADARPPVPRRPRVAVMELRPLETAPAKAEILSEVALTEATAIGGLEVIGRSDINALLGLEKQRQLLGCGEDTSCLVEIGGALGVDYLLTGSLGRLGALYRVDLRLVDARKARVLDRAGESVSGDEEKLVATIQRGVRRLLAPISPATAAAPAATSATGAAPAAASATGAAPTAAPTRFDGTWSVRVVCPPTDDARGYDLSFAAVVAGGQIDGLHGSAGRPGSLHLTGAIAADGDAMLRVDGRVGDPSVAIRRATTGSPVHYRVKARFDERSGTGKRLGARACDFTFTRR
jgi:TolB-like protein